MADIFCVNGHQLPQLQLIGAQKCGTTSLSVDLFHEWGFCDGTTRKKAWPACDHFNHDAYDKEKHAFDSGNQFDATLAAYARRFPPCGPNMLSLDATPDYLYASQAPGLLARAYGAERLNRTLFVVLLCDPVQRQQSSFYHLRWLAPPANSFKELVARETPAFSDSWWKIAFYDEQIKRWADAVGDIVVIPAAAFYESSDKTLKALAQEFERRTGRSMTLRGKAEPWIRNVHPHAKLKDDIAEHDAPGLATFYKASIDGTYNLLNNDPRIRLIAGSLLHDPNFLETSIVMAPWKQPPLPPLPPPLCATWCVNGEHPWAEVCHWPKCVGCVACAPPLPPPAASPSSPKESPRAVSPSSPPIASPSSPPLRPTPPSLPLPSLPAPSVEPPLVAPPSSPLPLPPAARPSVSLNSVQEVALELAAERERAPLLTAALGLLLVFNCCLAGVGMVCMAFKRNHSLQRAPDSSNVCGHTHSAASRPEKVGRTFRSASSRKAGRKGIGKPRVKYSRPDNICDGHDLASGMGWDDDDDVDQQTNDDDVDGQQTNDDDIDQQTAKDDDDVDQQAAKADNDVDQGAQGRTSYEKPAVECTARPKL